MSEMYQFLITKFNEIDYSQEALQCLMYSINSICQSLKTVDLINS